MGSTGRAKGLIVAAGYGTRFLPITRTIPKEMLPLVDRPCLDLVVSELADAGVRDILVVTSRRKKALDDWFDRDPELEAAVAADADKSRRAAPRDDVSVRFVRQTRMQGTGDAILLARAFAGDDPLVVAFPDDLFGDPNPTEALLATHARTGAAVLACRDLSGQDVSAYGVLDAQAEADGTLRVRRVVEKPAPGTEPSHLISLGRYLYTPALLEQLARHRAAHDGGEYTPMRAMEDVAAAGGLVACPIAAPRWDTGTPLGYLEAVVDHALAHPRWGDAFRDLIADRLDRSADRPPPR